MPSSQLGRMACRVLPQQTLSPGQPADWAASCKQESQAELTALHLNFDCPLFARKFPLDTAEPLHAFLTNCSNPLHILQCQDASVSL